MALLHGQDSIKVSSRVLYTMSIVFQTVSECLVSGGVKGSTASPLYFRVAI
jgi:hypothetical protein